MNEKPSHAPDEQKHNIVYNYDRLIRQEWKRFGLNMIIGFILLICFLGMMKLLGG